MRQIATTPELNWEPAGSIGGVDLGASRRVVWFCQDATFVVMTRASMIEDFACFRGAGGLFIYSLWPGYLDHDRIDLREWARDRALAFHVVHSPGHASVRDLQRLVEALQPKRVVPIHTDHPTLFASLFPCVERCDNGTWVDL